MKYLAAYMLLQLGGETSPKADGIKKVLSSVGIETDDERLNKLISELEGKNIQELITAGQAKLASVPSGGAGGAAPAAGASAAAAGGDAAPAAEEKKKEEAKEESDEDMGFGLFD